MCVGCACVSSGDGHGCGGVYVCGVEMCVWRLHCMGLVHSTNISTILRAKHLVLPLWWLEWWPWVGGHLLGGGHGLVGTY